MKPYLHPQYAFIAGCLIKQEARFCGVVLGYAQEQILIFTFYYHDNTSMFDIHQLNLREYLAFSVKILFQKYECFELRE